MNDGLVGDVEVPLRQAVASQYSALNGLLMRSANGETSNSLSVGIFSPFSVVRLTPESD